MNLIIYKIFNQTPVIIVTRVTLMTVRMMIAVQSPGLVMVLQTVKIRHMAVI